MKNTFIEKIASGEAVIGVIGLGYVGLPLLIEFSKVGFPICGLDIDPGKVEKLQKGISYIKHLSHESVSKAFCENQRSQTTTDFSAVSQCDAIIICVPTPLTRNRDPDMSYIEATAEKMAPFLRKGQLVTLESTTYPGTTEEVLVPALEKFSGLKAGADFYVAYSPEREDPNNPKFSTATIPKVIGGWDTDSLDLAKMLYDRIICETIPVSNCRTAEATKLMENIFRCINIALVNELKMVFTEMKIDIWEVIRAASTKPFGFMPFYPGPGLGGHCIPIDPFYLTWKAREFGRATKFIELAGEINTWMPDYVIHQVMLALNEHGKSLKNAQVLLVGLAYKPNVDDDRESPTYALWKLLEKHGAQVRYHDPLCPEIRPSREHADLTGIQSRPWETLADDTYDIAVISTAHDCVDHDALLNVAPIVMDTRGVCSDLPGVYRA